MEGVDLSQLSEALYRAPFVLLSHNRFQAGVTDPLFTYANHAGKCDRGEGEGGKGEGKGCSGGQCEHGVSGNHDSCCCPPL